MEPKKVAIEVRSYSKTAGFTGLRCGYTVVPRELKGKYADGSDVSLNTLWNRRQTTKFNGASYIAQKGLPRSILRKESHRSRLPLIIILVMQLLSSRHLYRQVIRHLEGRILHTYGYMPERVWIHVLFDQLLRVCGFSTTPGSGFGTKGDGYVRLTGFNSRENTEKAMLALLNREKD